MIEAAEWGARIVLAFCILYAALAAVARSSQFVCEILRKI